MTDIFITDWSSISPLGSDKNEIWKNYLLPKTFITSLPNGLGAALHNPELQTLSQNHKVLKHADKTVLMAILAGQNLTFNQQNCGVNIGSSRGATEQLETLIADFHKGNATPVYSSPYTTLGNISALLAHQLSLDNVAFDHSITCSTSLNAVVNATAWLRANMAENFIVGGSEAPLTPFTLAQMQAMKIYAQPESPLQEFPCRAGDKQKATNTMTLGEGCALLSLSKSPEKAIAKIAGVGVAMEKIKHASSISEQGYSLQQSMKRALGNRKQVDVIVSHTPGTIAGDKAEYNAVEAVFGESTPLITNNKWKIGHTFGASGALSIAFGLQMIQNQTFVGLPWENNFLQETDIQSILINSVGFGGNATSILIEKH